MKNSRVNNRFSITVSTLCGSKLRFEASFSAERIVTVRVNNKG